MDVKLLVERGVVKVLDLSLVLVVVAVLAVLVVVVVVLVLGLDVKLGEEERVRDRVVHERLGKRVLSERAEEEELQSPRQGVEGGVGGRKDSLKGLAGEDGFTRFRVLPSSRS